MASRSGSKMPAKQINPRQIILESLHLSTVPQKRSYKQKSVVILASGPKGFQGSPSQQKRSSSMQSAGGSSRVIDLSSFEDIGNPEVKNSGVEVRSWDEQGGNFVEVAEAEVMPESKPSVSLPLPTIPLTGEALGNETLDIYVGPKRKRFTIHAKLLQSHTTYFEYKEVGQNARVEQSKEWYFADEDSTAFNYFVDYMYRGTVTSGAADLENIPHLVNFYRLAEMFRVSTLMDQIIDNIDRTLASSTRTFGKMNLIGEIYKKSQGGSKLRQLAAAVMFKEVVSFTSPRVDTMLYFISVLYQDCPDLLLDYVKFHVQGGKFKEEVGKAFSQYGLGTCDFHVHTENEKCYLFQKAG